MTKAEFINILKKNGYEKELIDYILSKNIKRILGRKIDEIEKIIELLKQEKIEIRNCLSVLAFGKSTEIEKIINLLRQENISINKIVDFNMHYLLYEKYENVENLVMFKNSYYNDDEIKKHFKLKYTINRFYSKKEIEEIFEGKNIDISRFLNIFKIKNKSLKEEIIKKINGGKQLWIGNNYQCTKEQLENNKEFILKMCHIVSTNFAKKYNCIHLINDLEGCVLDIIIDKCGDLFYEYEDKDILFGSIYSYCIKSLHKFINKNTLQIIDNKKYNSDINYEEYSSKVLQDINLDITEREIIDYMSYLLENGIANYEENIKNKYSLNNDEYIEIIEKVKIKIINSKNKF